MTTTKKAGRAAVDWRWQHGPVSGPVHASVALAAAGLVGTLPAVDLSTGWVLAGGAATMGVATLRSRWDGTSWTRLGWRLATLGGATVWLAHAVTAGWTTTLGWTLAAGAVTAGALWRPVRAHDEAVLEQRAVRKAELDAAAADEAEQDRLHDVADVWVRRLERVARVQGTKVLGIEDWMFPGPDGEPRRTGYTLEVLLPTTGETWQTVAAYADGLASAADLPEGCGVEVGPGRSRRRCLIEVSLVDALRDDILLPVPSTPRTINDPVPIGTVRNGATTSVGLRFESAILVGAVGSGKSNELQTILAGLLSCADTLVCVIDYNGGGVALPWLQSWAEGEIDGSPILWVADGEDEAFRMCSWLLAVIEHRKRAYHAENAARDDDKIAASPRTPQIVLVTDEVGALDRSVVKLIAQISDRGRAAAVRTVTCALRALSEYIPTEVLAQANVRIGMRVNDRKELGYLYDWAGGRGGPSPEDAPYVGYGHVRTGATPAKVFKGYRTSPAMIRQVAVAQAAWRPELDQVTAQMPGELAEAYRSRWERAAHLIAAAGGSPATSRSGAASSSGAVPDSPGASGTDRPAESFGEVLDELGSAAERLRDAVNAETSSPGSGNEEFDRIAEAFDVVPELLAFAVAAFRTSERMHTRDLADTLGVRTEVLGQLLSQLEVRPLPNAFAIDGGKPARGYRRADLEAAVQRIVTGDLEVPESVTAWRPSLPPEWS